MFTIIIIIIIIITDVQAVEQQGKVTGEQSMPWERRTVQGGSGLEAGASPGVQQGSLKRQAPLSPQSHSSPSWTHTQTDRQTDRQT